MDQPLTITIDPFVTDPAGCEITYSHTVTATFDGSTVSLADLTFDSSALQFTFSTTDLKLAYESTDSRYVKDYTIEISAASFDETTSVSFTLSVINPCDPDLGTVTWDSNISFPF